MSEQDVLDAIAALAATVGHATSGPLGPATGLFDDTEGILSVLGPVTMPSPGSVTTALYTIKAKTDTIGSLEVTVTSPINTAGDIEVQQGQDLAVDLGTQIDFDITSGVILNKSWTSAVATLYFNEETLAGSISAISGGQRLRFIATAAVTALWEAGVFDYKAEVVFSDSEKYPILGEITVVEDIP